MTPSVIHLKCHHWWNLISYSNDRILENWASKIFIEKWSWCVSGGLRSFLRRFTIDVPAGSLKLVSKYFKYFLQRAWERFAGRWWWLTRIVSDSLQDQIQEERLLFYRNMSDSGACSSRGNIWWLMIERLFYSSLDIDIIINCPQNMNLYKVTTCSNTKWKQKILALEWHLPTIKSQRRFRCFISTNRIISAM